MPISIAVFILAFYSSNDIVIKFIISGVLGFFGYNVFCYLSKCKEEIHGSSLKRFKELYANLLIHASTENVVAATAVIAYIVEAVKEIADDDPYHYDMFIKAFDNAIHSHNASIGSSYIDGVKDTLGIFKFDSIDNIVNKKYEILTYCFGHELPFSKAELKRGHLNFLANSLHKQ